MASASISVTCRPVPGFSENVPVARRVAIAFEAASGDGARQFDRLDSDRRARRQSKWR